MISFRKSFLSFLLLTVLHLYSPHYIYADTNISGVISTNTTWTVAGSPYIVVGNVLLNSGYTLTIEPGVVVKFDGAYVLETNGTLIAQGTLDNRITFEGTTPSTHWESLKVNGAGSIVSYAIIRDAYPNSSPGAINITNSRLDNSEISNSGRGIYAIDSEVHNNKIQEGLAVIGANAIATGNEIYNVSSYLSVISGAIFRHNYVHDNGTLLSIHVDNGTIEYNTILGNGGGSQVGIKPDGNNTVIRYNNIGGFSITNILIQGQAPKPTINYNNFVGDDLVVNIDSPCTAGQFNILAVGSTGCLGWGGVHYSSSTSIDAKYNS